MRLVSRWWRWALLSAVVMVSLPFAALLLSDRLILDAPDEPDVATGAVENIVARGEYLTRAGGCFSCHTAPGGEPLAGGRALATPFGTFYSPNLTPDVATGIGGWTDSQFVRALRKGVRPDGSDYFPVFPYPSFTGITTGDALAIKAYLSSRPAVRHPDREHDVAFPFSWRFLQSGWRLLFFKTGPFRPSPDRNTAYNRGAYLVTALSHCGECHTPRRATRSAPFVRSCGWPATPMAQKGRSFPTSRRIRQPGSASGQKVISSNC
jgi:mono/diheme cytochrome c family protein